MANFVSRVFGRTCSALLQNIQQKKVTHSAVRLASIKAAVLRELKGELKIETVEAPKKINKGEVRIKVYACGLNVSDQLITRGEYDVTPKLPFIPGHEVAGKITEVGPGVSEEYSCDTKVLALTKNEFGGLSEEIVVNETDIWTLPSSISYETAAALADNYTTVLISLCRRAKITENDVILIGAGSGGLGLAAVDVAANVYKAKTIVICSTEERAEILRQKGAWAALHYTDKGILKKVKEVTNGKGVRVVFDAAGGPLFETAVKCVAHEGIVIAAGHAIRQIPNLRIADLIPKSFSLMGVSLRNYLQADPAVYRQTVQDAIDMCEQELIHPQVLRKFKFSEASKGLKQLDDEDCPGKVLVEIDD